MVITNQYENCENTNPFTEEGRNNLFFAYFGDVFDLTDDIVNDDVAKQHREWKKSHPVKKVQQPEIIPNKDELFKKYFGF